MAQRPTLRMDKNFRYSKLCNLIKSEPPWRSHHWQDLSESAALKSNRNCSLLKKEYLFRTKKRGERDKVTSKRTNKLPFRVIKNLIQGRAHFNDDASNFKLSAGVLSDHHHHHQDCKTEDTNQRLEIELVKKRRHQKWLVRERRGNQKEKRGETRNASAAIFRCQRRRTFISSSS